MYARAVSGSIVYFGGDFRTIGGEAGNSIAAIDESIGMATHWDPSPNISVYSLALPNDVVYFRGTITTVKDEISAGIAAVAE